MHEMAMVRNVVDIVVDKAQSVNAGEVRSVRLAIGMGRDIVEEYFEGVFQYLARNTVASHAQVIIDRVPVTVKCKQCGCVFPIVIADSKTWVCPICGAEKDYSLVSGMEFIIRDIEIVPKLTEAEVLAAS